MKRYAIVIEDAGTNLAAYVPDVPGCVATGKSKEEVERLVHEAVVLHLEGMAEDGLPIPEPSSHVEYVEIDREAKHVDGETKRPTSPLSPYPTTTGFPGEAGPV